MLRCQVIEVDGTCSMADPEGFTTGAVRVQCQQQASCTGKIGELLCPEHAETYPEPQYIRRINASQS